MFLQWVCPLVRLLTWGPMFWSTLERSRIPATPAAPASATCRPWRATCAFTPERSPTLWVEWSTAWPPHTSCPLCVEFWTHRALSFVQCDKCDVHFRHKSQLRLHLRQKHGAVTNTKVRYKLLTEPYQPVLQACWAASTPATSGQDKRHNWAKMAKFFKNDRFKIKIFNGISFDITKCLMSFGICS